MVNCRLDRKNYDYPWGFFDLAIPMNGILFLNILLVFMFTCYRSQVMLAENYNGENLCGDRSCQQREKHPCYARCTMRVDFLVPFSFKRLTVMKKSFINVPHIKNSKKSHIHSKIKSGTDPVI